jgi:hypothetical protein
VEDANSDMVFWVGRLLGKALYLKLIYEDTHAYEIFVLIESFCSKLYIQYTYGAFSFALWGS